MLLLSVYAVLSDATVLVSSELIAVLQVSAVAVVVLHSKESSMQACATSCFRCCAYLSARTAYLQSRLIR